MLLKRLGKVQCKHAPTCDWFIFFNSWFTRDVFDKDTAAKARKYIYSSGNTVEPGARPVLD